MEASDEKGVPMTETSTTHVFLSDARQMDSFSCRIREDDRNLHKKYNTTDVYTLAANHG